MTENIDTKLDKLEKATDDLAKASEDLGRVKEKQRLNMREKISVTVEKIPERSLYLHEKLVTLEGHGTKMSIILPVPPTFLAFDFGDMDKRYKVSLHELGAAVIGAVKKHEKETA